jgi:hypothetical protein
MATSFKRTTRALAEDAVQRSSSVTSSVEFPNPLWNQPNWYVDWVGGNDSNSGADPAHPVKTFMGGIVAKWETVSPLITVPVVIYVMSSQPTDAESITLLPVLSGSDLDGISSVEGELSIQPYAETGTSFVLAGVVPKNRATGQLLQATAPAGAAPGKLIVNTTRGSKVIIQSVVAGVVTLLTPYNETTFSTDDTWANGDDCVLVTMYTINAVVVGFSLIYDLTMLDASGTPGTTYICPEVCAFYNCWIQPNVFMGLGFANCAYSGVYMDPATGAAEIRGECTLVGGYFPAGVLCTDNSIELDVTGDTLLGPCTILGVGEIFDVYLLDTVTVDQGARYELDGSAWGPGALGVTRGGSLNVPNGGTWVASYLAVGPLTIDGLNQATRYAAGVWTDGIAITTAALDADGCLQNPVSGSRLYTVP